jgi:hypothetical protein
MAGRSFSMQQKAAFSRSNSQHGFDLVGAVVEGLAVVGEVVGERVVGEIVGAAVVGERVGDEVVAA